MACKINQQHYQYPNISNLAKFTFSLTDKEFLVQALYKISRIICTDFLVKQFNIS